MYLCKNNLTGNLWREDSRKNFYARPNNLKVIDNNEKEKMKPQKKTEYYIDSDDYFKNNKCDGNTHGVYTIGMGGYLEETNPMYCTSGYDLEGVACGNCAAVFIHKGKSISGQTFHPSHMVPAYTCCNCMKFNCTWVLCGPCFILKAKANTLGRSKRSNQSCCVISFC